MKRFMLAFFLLPLVVAVAADPVDYRFGCKEPPAATVRRAAVAFMRNGYRTTFADPVLGVISGESLYVNTDVRGRTVLEIGADGDSVYVRAYETRDAESGPRWVGKNTIMPILEALICGH